jgi:hypothetical protein
MRRWPLKVNQSFGGIRHLHPQGQRINQETNQPESGSKPFWLLPNSLFLVTPVLATCFKLVSGKPCAFHLFHVGFLFGLFFDPEDEWDTFLRNVSWVSPIIRMCSEHGYTRTLLPLLLIYSHNPLHMIFTNINTLWWNILGSKIRRRPKT